MTDAPARFSKLPPIVTNPSDREFLQDLYKQIDNNLGEIDENDPEHRFTVHQDAFNQIIDHVIAYRPVLTAIKNDYESHIELLRKNRREALFLNAKLKTMASEPTTIRNYKRRTCELEEKIEMFEEENEELREKLQSIREFNEDNELAQKKLNEPPPLKRDSRLIPGLTLEQSTDVPLLKKKHRRLEWQLHEVKKCYENSYVDKIHQTNLKNLMMNRVEQRDDLKERGELNQSRLEKLKVAVNAASAYNEMKPPNQTVGDLVLYAMEIAACRKNGKPLTEEQSLLADILLGDLKPVAPSSSTQEDDDPIKDKEAEEMLEYIDRFNELFEAERYQEAAFHAVSGHKGILRTMATLNKFKAVKMLPLMSQSPLMLFCEALLLTVPSFGAPLCRNMSIECVRCAILEKRVDLLVHWISQQRLTLSSAIGDLISSHCQCQTKCLCVCQALAESVYRATDCYEAACIAMLKQGRVHAMVSHSLQHRIYSQNEYIYLLNKWYSPDLFLAMVERDRTGRQAIETGVAVMEMIRMGHEHVCVRFLNELFEGSNETSSASVNESNHTLLDLVSFDRTTTLKEWFIITNLLDKHNYHDVSVELMSAALVTHSFHDAISAIQFVYKSQEFPSLHLHPPPFHI